MSIQFSVDPTTFMCAPTVTGWGWSRSRIDYVHMGRRNGYDDHAHSLVSRLTVVGLLRETGHRRWPKNTGHLTHMETERSRRQRLEFPGLILWSPGYVRGIPISYFRPHDSTWNRGASEVLYFGQLTRVKYGVILGVYVLSSIFVFQTRFVGVEVSNFLVVGYAYSFFFEFLRLLTFLVTEEQRFIDVIEGSLRRIGSTLPTLLSEF